MRFIITITIFSVVTDSCWTQTTMAPQKDILQKTTLNHQKEDPLSAATNRDENSYLRALWVPMSAYLTGVTYGPRPVVFRQPYTLTKLVRTLTNGIDPYFSKGYFEPFERRPKPVTLVALRKKGRILRKTIKISAYKPQVAEKQSPFNLISNL